MGVGGGETFTAVAPAAAMLSVGRTIPARIPARIAARIALATEWWVSEAVPHGTPREQRIHSFNMEFGPLAGLDTGLAFA